MAGSELHQLVPITPIGPIIGATRIWRQGTALQLTVVAKTTFKLMPNAPMRLLPRPVPISVKDVPYRDSPSASVVATSDLALRRNQCDVIYVGNAYAKGREPITQRHVRLGFRGSDGGALIDKSILVMGNRRRVADHTLTQPKPFRRIPLIYERAVGGIGYDDNPLGLGHGPGAEVGRQPNLYGVPEEQSTACYAPFSPAWPPRAQLLNGFRRREFRRSVVGLPNDFDFNFFQTAPPDQRVPFLRGGEELRLEGLTPGGGAIVSTIPNANVLMHEAATEALLDCSEFVADGLLIDGKAETCSITWRCLATLPDFSSLDGLGLLLAVQLDDEMVSWPEQQALVARVKSGQSFADPIFDEPEFVNTTFSDGVTKAKGHSVVLEDEENGTVRNR